MIYRQVEAEEIHRSLFDAFIRRQVVTKCRRKVEDVWVVRDDPFIDDWNEEDYSELLEELRCIQKCGGVVYGAYDSGVLKGFAAVDGRAFGADHAYLDLVFLHVSADVRGRGVGRALFALAANWAASRGAKKLYLSAHSAVETQAFYSAVGCVEAEEYCPAHVEKEPFDCQMEYVL